MTTYSFGAQAFEAVPFWRLRGAGCYNITLLADAGMFNQEMASFGAAQFAGSSYHVVKVRQKGAFHPKITLLLGQKKGKLLVGSANLTAAGLGGNRELVAEIKYDRDNEHHAALFRQAIDYLQSKVPSDDPWFDIALNRAKRRTPWLHSISQENESEIGAELILDRPGRSILAQLSDAVGGDEIERITIMSPYWDSELRALKELRAAFAYPPIRVLIDAPEMAFPTDALRGLDNVEIYDLDALGSARFVHAKLIVLEGKEADHVLSGSINCSAPAMLQGSIKNSEAGIYTKVARGSALDSLGITPSLEEPLDPASIPNFAKPGPGDDQQGASFRDGGEVVCSDRAIEWKGSGGAGWRPEEVRLYTRANDQVGHVLKLENEVEKRWILRDGDKRPRTAVVTFSDGVVSAPVPIVDLSVLQLTTKPASGSKRNKIEDSIADMQFEDLDLFEALSQLEALEHEDDEADGALRNRRQVGNQDTGQREASGRLPYKEFVKRREESSAVGQHAAGPIVGVSEDRPSDLVSECLNRIIGLVSAGHIGEEIDALEELEDDAEPPNEGSENTDDEDGEGPEGDAPGEGRSGGNNRRRRSAKAILRQVKRGHASKIKQAVDGYEKYCRGLPEGGIGTEELVRLRVLLQIVLRYAQPISGGSEPHQVLPVYDSQLMGWPRLVGRLLIQHFGRDKLIERLELSENDTERKRVLEYLSTCLWTAHAAQKAVADVRQANPIKVSLQKIVADLQAITSTFVANSGPDRDYLGQIVSRLDEHFGFSLKMDATSISLNRFVFEKD